MIVDVHAHLVGVGEANGCYIADDMRRGLLYRYLKFTLGLGDVPDDELDRVYREKLVDWVEASDLDGVGLLALDGVYDDDGDLDRERTSVLVSNDYCLEVADESRALHPVCSVNPNRSDAIEELERVFDRGAAAIKLLPNSQAIDPMAPEHQSFWRRMAELGIPLLSHTSFEHTIPPIEQKFGHPERLRAVLDEGVTVIAAHCGSSGVAHWTEHFDLWCSMLDRYPNLFGDVSAMTSVARFPYATKVLEDDIARSRAMLGSDFPVPSTPWVFVGELGWTTTRRVAEIDNPFQQNLEIFRALGAPQSLLRRGARLLRM